MPLRLHPVITVLNPHRPPIIPLLVFPGASLRQQSYVHQDAASVLLLRLAFLQGKSSRAPCYDQATGLEILSHTYMYPLSKRAQRRVKCQVPYGVE